MPNQTKIDVNEIQYYKLKERLQGEHQLLLDAERKKNKLHLHKLDACESATIGHIEALELGYDEE